MSVNGAADYVFILDISGSMAEEGKLRISRDCIQAFLDQLGKKDRFEVITFNVRPDALFGKLQLADDAHRTQAREYLATRKAAGGTVLRPALTTAYKYRDPDRALNIVVLSDGMTEQGERRQLTEAVAARPAGARVFCVGVGNEVNRPLLKQMAEDAGGLASFLSRGDNFSRQAKAFRRKLLKPAMTNVKITFAGGGVYDLEPASLPNLYHGAPVRMYGRYRKGDSAKITLAAEINGQPFKQTMPVTFPDRDAGNPEISRMWAWHRIQSLLKEADRPGSRQAMIDEVVRLGESYSVATQYTSFIVLENDAEYRRWKIKQRNANSIQRDRKARGQLLAELERLRDRSMQAIGPRPPRQTAETTDGSPAPSPAPQTAPGLGPVTQRDNSWDVGPVFPTGAGGGPIGPIGLGILGVLAAGELLRRRRRSAK